MAVSSVLRDFPVAWVQLLLHLAIVLAVIIVKKAHALVVSPCVLEGRTPTGLILRALINVSFARLASTVPLGPRQLAARVQRATIAPVVPHR